MANIGNRNRQAGHAYEKEEVALHRKYFAHIATTRACNRARDACGIDICNRDESEVGRLPLDISCKAASANNAPPARILANMESHPGRIKVLLHKQTHRPVSKKGELSKLILTKGKFVHLEREGYEAFLQCMVAIQHLRKIHPEAVKAVEEKMGVSLFEIPVNQLT